jgi:hypothetical protein
MPWNEDRNLRHHPVGKGVGGSEMGEIFQRVHDELRFVELGSTVRTIANMGLQGSNPEAHLVIEEEIDLVWKQVPVIH